VSNPDQIQAPRPATARPAKERKVARTVMNREPVSAPANATLAECARLMREHKTSVLPIVDAERQVIGIVTEGDLLRPAGLGAPATASGEDRRPHWTEFLAAPVAGADALVAASGRRASDVMTTRVICVRPDMPLADVATILDEWKIESVPVIDGGRLVGTVSHRDLTRAMIGARRMRVRAAASDDSIRSGVVSCLEEVTWLTGGAGIEVTVTDGTVILYGYAASAEEAVAIEFLAEAVPGVRFVESYLKVGQHAKYRN
jgi:CBS domain-containing protein